MSENQEANNQLNTSPPVSVEQPKQTENEESILQRPFSRRTILKIGAALGLGTVVGVVGGNEAANIIAPDNAPGNKEQEKAPDQLEFGFNTHLHGISFGEGDNMTLDAFKGDVDKLVSTKQEWIRFDVINEGVAQIGQDGKPVFSDKLAVYDQALTYAKEKGLKIALVTSVPNISASSPIDQYVASAVAFYSELAGRFKDKIDTCQIFNEADTHHFRDYHDISQGAEPSYLDDLAKVVAASAEAIKAISPSTKITMNASLWSPNKNIIRDRTSRFFDAIQGSLDFISLDPYPDVFDPNSAQTIPQDIEYFHNKYNKDIVIAEIGVSAFDIKDNNQRTKILLNQIAAIKGGTVLPKAVFIYEMRNENANNDPKEAAFGTQDFIGQLTEQMQPQVNQSAIAPSV